MKKQFCTFCLEDVSSKLYKEKVKENIDGNDIEYLEKYYICPKCNSKIYGDMFDYNIHAANDELRKISGLIRTCEIEEIINKYSISQKNLSLILGFGEIQISRYLKSGNPSKKHSDILKSVLNNPFVFEMYLLDSKDILDSKAFKKSMSKVKQLELTSDHSKIYNVSTYLIEKNNGMDNLTLQKVLYFINGFSKKFLNHKLFNDIPKAWIYGPVYEEIYDAFAPFTKELIEYPRILKDKEYDLTSDEKKYIDNVFKYFSCYSGGKLIDMSHLTDPWIIAREGLKEDEYTDRELDIKDIDKYFDSIIEKYNIKKYEDIRKYSSDLFDKTF